MVRGSMMRLALKLPVIVAATLSLVWSETPNGFVTYSKGDDYDRTLYLREMTVAGGLEEEQLICEKGSRGGDIQGVISFDGRFLAFARSQGAGGGYGGDDYHNHEKFDVYIVRLDGPLPATPIEVAHGYWPSWSDDSYNQTKTLYYSTHPDGTVRAVTVSPTGDLSNDRLIHNVKSSWPDHYEGFLMAGPTGEWAAFRARGSIKIGHWEGSLAGQKVGGSGGCMPSVCADGIWIINAHNKCQRSDGTYAGSILGDGSGDYHYGTSTDMNWLIARTEGGYQVQNDGRNVFLFKLTVSETSLSSERQDQVTESGSWPDVHVGPLSKDVSINDFRAEPSHIATGNSTTLMWNVWNATSLSINGESVTGESKTVTPSATTDYTLTAEGQNGPVSKTITVTVSAPELTSITLSPDQAVLAVNETMDFTAATLDQSGNAFNSPISWSLSGGGSLSSASGTATTFTSDGSVGEFTLTVQSGSLEKVATITITDPSSLHLKINCGPNEHDVAGWERDDEYLTGGVDFSFGGSVSTAGVTDAAPEGVYKGVVHFEQKGTSHTYSFPTIPNGTYTVRMHYNDAYGGDRKMNYKFEGDVLISDLDIDDEAGGTSKALVKELSVTVLDGNGLQIECYGTGESDVFECGIEVIGGSSTTPQETIAITGQYAGQSYAIGDELTIQWNATDDVGDVVLEVSPDGGQSWLAISSPSVTADDPGYGAYPWTIPADIEGTSLASDNAVLRVMDYDNGDVFDVSGVFSITDPATILRRTESLSRRGLRLLTTPAAGIEATITVPESYRIEVLDLRGRTLFREAGMGPSEVRWSGVPGAGTYILRLRYGRTEMQRRLLVR